MCVGILWRTCYSVNCWTLTAVSDPVGLGSPRICVFNKILGSAAVISLLGHAFKNHCANLAPHICSNHMYWMVRII